jgi:hypothetical protein
MDAFIQIFFFQERYMLNEVNTRIKMTRSKDAFCLMATGDQAYKAQITSAALVTRKVRISPPVYLAHAKALENGMPKYPIHRVICKTFTVPAGYLDVSHEKLFTGQLPSRLIIGCVDNTSFNGDVSRNLLNFKHFSLSEIMVYLDGQQHGIKPLTSNFANGLYISSFMSLFRGIGKANREVRFCQRICIVCLRSNSGSFRRRSFQLGSSGDRSCRYEIRQRFAKHDHCHSICRV